MRVYKRAVSALILTMAVLWPLAAAAQVSAAEAAPFVGSWTLKFDGPMGPLEVKLKVAIEEGKVVGDMAGELLGNAKSTDAIKGPNGLTLKYTLDVMGMMLPGAITLTPDGANFKATFDIADGAFSMPGTATKGA